MSKIIAYVLVFMAVSRAFAGPMVVSALKGAKVVSTVSGVSTTLANGSQVPSGAVVYGETGAADFKLGGGGHLVVEPGTRFVPQAAEGRRDGLLKLLSGEIILKGTGDASVSSRFGLLSSWSGNTSVLYVPGSLAVVGTLKIVTAGGATFYATDGTRFDLPAGSMLLIKEGYAPVVTKIDVDTLVGLSRLAEGAAVADVPGSQRSAGANPLPGQSFSPPLPAGTETAPGVPVDISQLNPISPNGEGQLN